MVNAFKTKKSIIEMMKALYGHFLNIYNFGNSN